MGAVVETKTIFRLLKSASSPAKVCVSVHPDCVSDAFCVGLLCVLQCVLLKRCFKIVALLVHQPVTTRMIF